MDLTVSVQLIFCVQSDSALNNNHTAVYGHCDVIRSFSHDSLRNFSCSYFPVLLDNQEHSFFFCNANFLLRLKWCNQFYTPLNSSTLKRLEEFSKLPICRQVNVCHYLILCTHSEN